MIKVLAVASEIHPLIKTGGLADVVGALPAALKGHDVAVTTVIPGYPAVMAASMASVRGSESAVINTKGVRGRGARQAVYNPSGPER